MFACLTNRFFGLMGTVFGFVASDVTSKIEILQEFRQGANGDQFETVEQMIIFEKKQQMLDNPKYVSASRTLLRLHRALCKFIPLISV